MPKPEHLDNTLYVSSHKLIEYAYIPLISLVFSVRTVNYGSSFFSIDLWPNNEDP